MMAEDVIQPFEDGHQLVKQAESAVVPPDRGYLNLSIDFSRPDGYRARPLVVEGKRLYVCEHYMGVWSPVLRSLMLESTGRDVPLANFKFRQIREVLECISPMHKDISERNYGSLLPVAYEYQMSGLLFRCENFLLDSRLPFLDRVWLADKYRLDRLLSRCLRELRPTERMDFSGPQYHRLSDRVKVLLLERMQGAPAPEEFPEPPPDLDRFTHPTEIHFASLRGTGRKTFYINPYYVAAWSSVVQDRISCQNATEFVCGASVEELKAFLLAIHPPQLQLTEDNIAPVLVAGCKMESQGLIQRCAKFLLFHAELSVFAKLSLLDRCFLHELLEPCLRVMVAPEQALDMTLQPTYHCLSTKARAAILDRLGALLTQPGLTPHHCFRCRKNSRCPSVAWECPHCGHFHKEEEKM